MTAADFSATVVGAGVIGLAIARELSLRGHSVLVLEAAASAGSETSSRNSEVIHAGIYYPTGSLKAKTCVSGRERLYDYCASRGVATKRLGKLIVANSPAEEKKLHSIFSQAAANGVTDLQWLSAKEAAEFEPEILCTKALFSPSTGIVDAKGYMLALQGEAEDHGCSFAFRTRFTHAEKKDGILHITAMSEDGVATEFTTDFIFNCAGHGAHAAASSIDDYPPKALPPRYLAKGSYCSVSGRPLFRHLIYPVPVSGALGIHATLDLGGALRFGPDIRWIDTLDYSLPDGLAETFKRSVQNYWPGVRDRELTPTYCGIRPKLHGPDSGFGDFLIQTESEHGVPKLVNFFGIESPGLTASLALAEEAAARCAA